MIKRAVGLYIGANSVSVVELKGGFRRPRLARFGRTEISSSAKEGPEDHEITEAIQKVLHESGIKAKEVACALSPEEVTVRYFNMPRLPKKEWAQGVRFEAKKYLPFNLEEINSDFKVIQTRAAKQMEVVFAAAKKEAVLRYTSLLQDAGLKASVVEPAPFSLMRLFHLTKEVEKEKTTAIVDIDMEGATISIVKDRVLYLARNISLAKSPGEPQKPVFENLLGELSLSSDYYKKQFHGQTIDKVILCGEGSFEGWDELLEKELSLPVTVGDWRKGVGRANKVDPNISPKLAVACGVALRKLVKPKVGLSLLPGKRAEAAPLPREAVRRAAIAEVVVGGLLLLVIYFGMFTQMARVKGELAEVVAARPLVKTELVVDKMLSRDLEAARGELEHQLSMLRVSIKERVYWTTKLNELARLLPKGVWLSRLTFDEKLDELRRKIVRSLVIEGGAFSKDKSEEMELVERVAARLKEDRLFFKGFGELKISSIEKGTRGEFEVTNFRLSCSGR